jgi:hypothetical protein
MARNWYGGTSADFAQDRDSSRLVPGAQFTVWTDREGGTQKTDLLDVNGTPSTLVTAMTSSLILYKGPDEDKTPHWLEPVGGGDRVAVVPLDNVGPVGPTPQLGKGTITTGPLDFSITGTPENPLLNLILPTSGPNGVGTTALQDGSVTAVKLAERYRLENRVTINNADSVCASTTRYLAQIGTLTATRTVTLPDAATVPAGAEIIIADESGTVTATNNIVIARAGTNDISGAVSIRIAQAYGWRRLVSNGVNRWSVDGGVLRGSSNLSDVSSPATALANLGGATKATLGNLLTANQAQPSTPGAYTVSNGAEGAAGVYTAITAMSVYTELAGAVAPGETVTLITTISRITGTVLLAGRLLFFDGANTQLPSPAITYVAAGTQVVTGVVPAGAAKVRIYPMWTDGGPGTAALSSASFHRGAGGLWEPPGVPIPNLGIRANPADPTQVQVWNPGNTTWITV